MNSSKKYSIQERQVSGSSCRQVKVSGNIFVKNMPEKNHKSSKNESGYNKSMPVNKIMKEIKTLKKQLQRVKSKKSISFHDKQGRAQYTLSKQQLVTKRVDQSAKKGSQQSPANKIQTVLKEKKSNICSMQVKPIQYSNKKKHNIQIEGFNGIKSRQHRLKLCVQVNKLKSLLTYFQCDERQLGLLVAQLNLIIMNLNNLFQNYENKMCMYLSESRELKDRLDTVTEKSIKTSEGYKRQKQKNYDKDEQILELRRKLSYYLEVQKLSKVELNKYIIESEELQSYIKQVQTNNQLMKQQLQALTAENLEIKQQNKNYENKIEKLSAQIILQKEQQKILNSNLGNLKESKRIFQQQIQDLREESLKNQLLIKKYEQQLQQASEQLTNNYVKIKQINEQLCLYSERQALMKQQIQESFMNKCQKDQQIRLLQDNVKVLQRQNQTLKNTNLQLDSDAKYCRIQIENLSKQVDELKKSNERYKNKCFRDRIIHDNPSKSNVSKAGKIPTQSRQPKKAEEKHLGKIKSNQGSQKKKILNEIHDLIRQHQASDYSQDN